MLLGVAKLAMPFQSLVSSRLMEDLPKVINKTEALSNGTQSSFLAKIALVGFQLAVSSLQVCKFCCLLFAGSATALTRQVCFGGL